MKVMITGGAGFVGRHLAGHLSSKGHEVISLDRVASEQVVGCDITNLAEMNACVSKYRPEAVVHLAGVAANQHPG